MPGKNYRATLEMNCSRDNCVFKVHSDKRISTAFCCRACNRGIGHGPLCEGNTNTYKPKFKLLQNLRAPQKTDLRSWFKVNELASIYNFPEPTIKRVIGVISFGGGLYGSIDKNGILTKGDVQKYWTSIGIPSKDHPRVILVTVDRAKNRPNVRDGGSTIENTLDVATVGGCAASSNITIILYLGPNSNSSFVNLLTRASIPTVVNGTSYTPNVISISWGAPEVANNTRDLDSINLAMKKCTDKGINICTATGDNGSNNGVGGTGNYVDFPSSSPHCTAVGGTTLVCPSKKYSMAGTTEIAWKDGGGGISTYFPKPSWQSSINASGRSTPDISSNSDPNTGVSYIVGGKTMVVGGTSVAAPTVAAFFACIGTSKFITPSLYTVPNNSFNDITSGSNGGYNSTLGYDNCTGRGSINGVILKTNL